MYCSSKSLSTPKCLVVCDISPEKAWELNESRIEDEKYTRKTFEDLVMRFEEPNHSNRLVSLRTSLLTTKLLLMFICLGGIHL